MTDRLISEAALLSLIDLKIDTALEACEAFAAQRFKSGVQQTADTERRAAIKALRALRNHLKFIDTAKETQ